MPQENIPALPDHRDCEVLTDLTINSVPRDDSLGRALSERAAMFGSQTTARTVSFFCIAGRSPSSVSSDRDGRELVLGVIEAGEPFGEQVTGSNCETKTACRFDDHRSIPSTRHPKV